MEREGFYSLSNLKMKIRHPYEIWYQDIRQIIMILSVEH